MFWLESKSEEQVVIRKLRDECLTMIQEMPDESKNFRAARLAVGRIHAQITSPFLLRADKLIGWLITGYAATLALAISHFEKLALAFGTQTVKPSLMAFFAALLLYWIQRMFTDATLAAGEALAGTETLTEKISSSSPTELEVADIAARMIAANPWPWRALAKRRLFEALQGDWDAPQRHAVNRSMRLAPFFFLGNLALLMYGIKVLLNY